MKYSVITFGCRVNQADSLGFEEELRAAGGESAPPDRADLVIVNTCSVTATADQGARQTIRRVARDNPNARIVVTGCYATRRPDDVRALPNVMRVIHNDDKPQLAAGLAADFGLTTAERFGDGEGSCGALIEPGLAGRTAFTLRVQTGCAEPCAYCIIPATRGRPRSMSVDAIVGEVERVTAAGFKEIALTGVHLGSYGWDLTPQSSLVTLLNRLAESPLGHSRARESTLEAEVLRRAGDPGSARSRARESTLEREVLERAGGGAPASGVSNAPLFRVSSLEPMDCVPDIVDLVAASGRFAPHFHLPLQHAADSVLARMRRPYTIERYSALVDLVRARIPAASIGSDLIVGFPGETDREFEELAAYLDRSPLTHVHVFPYSDRPGTAATAMPGKVPGVVVRQRAARVREIGRRLTSRFRESQVGTVHRGLTLEDGSLVVTGNYLKVLIPPGHARNEWVKVRVLTAGDPMTGESVE